jgi:hypothetical protein
VKLNSPYKLIFDGLFNLAGPHRNSIYPASKLMPAPLYSLLSVVFSIFWWTYVMYAALFLALGWFYGPFTEYGYTFNYFADDESSTAFRNAYSTFKCEDDSKLDSGVNEFAPRGSQGSEMRCSLYARSWFF